MMMPPLFLTTSAGKQFAILNLLTFSYIEGVEETDEHPDGSKTAIHLWGTGRVIDMPYRVVAEAIDKHIKHHIRLNAEISEEHTRRMIDANERMMERLFKGGNPCT